MAGEQWDFSAAADAVASGRGIDPVGPLRGAVHNAVGQNPEFEAEFRRVARKSGLPLEVVKAAPDESKRQAAMQEVNPDGLFQESPALARWLADQSNANIAHDDVGVLSQIERKARMFAGGAVDAAGLMLRGTGAGLEIGQRNLTNMLADMLPTPRHGAMTPEARAGLSSDLAGTDFKRAGKIVSDTGRRDIMPAGPQSFGDQVAAGLGQIVTQVPASMLLGPSTLFMQGFGQMDEKVQNDNAPQWKKDLAVLGGGAVTGITEKWALDKLLGPVAEPVKSTVAKVIARIGVAGASEGGQEFSENLLQDLLQKGLTNPDQKIGVSDALQAGGVGAAVGSIVRGVVEGALHVRTRGARQEARAQQAEQHAQTLGEMVDLAGQSKLLTRDPEAFSSFAQALHEEGVDRLYLDPKALATAGVDLQKLAQVMPSVAAQIEEAVSTGADVVVPTAEFLQAAPGAEFAQSLIEHARTSEDAMSQAQAREHMAQRQQEMTDVIGKALETRQADEAIQTSRDQVRDEFAAQLDAAGRFTPDVNRSYAELVADFYAAQAQRLGITPAEMAQRYPLQVRRDGLAGGRTLEQGEKVGAFGPQFEQFKGDAQGAIAHLMQQRSGEAIGALNHPELGDIDLVWGEEGTGASDGYGLAKLAKFHPEVLGDLQGTLSQMQVVQRGKNRVRLESQDHKASVRLTWDGESKHWLLTAFKKGGDDAGTTTDTAELSGEGDTARLSDASDESVDAKLKTFYQNARAQIAFGDDITQTPSVISLFKGADLSSFLHESGHFFLQAQADLASRIEGRARDGETLTDGEQQIVDDANTVLDWFGIKGDGELSALDMWHSMSVDEQREHHEKFARGFEAYAFEGKAPSLSLQGVFQRFRSWLVSIYKKLSALNVELTDEVRGVMDRMIATDQQIRDAQAARDMGPLFESAEQAGMTPQDWQAYNALGGKSTAEAVEDLQARGLRDMKWLRNARGREIKKLQKQAAGLRSEVEMEVRREVMSRPVYRAWQFLTLRGEQDQTAPPTPRVKKSGDLDPSKDNLFEAIAKMGGLNRDEVHSLWGTDPKDKLTSGVFGHPVLRNTGGLSVDAMLERLVEAGYILPDEFGKGDVADLEAAFDSQRRGSDVFSVEHDYAERARAAMGDAPVDALPDHIMHGKLSTEVLREMYGTADGATWRKLSDRRMTSDASGIHPEIVAETFGFSSADEMVKELAESQAPRDVIRAMTDAQMLQQHGELSSPESIERRADEAVHTQARARMVAAELAALQRAGSVTEKRGNGHVDALAQAARDYATRLIAGKRIRDIRPVEFANAAARAGRAALKAMRSGDVETAAAEKRAQLIQTEAERAAVKARDDVAAALDYFARVQKPGILPAKHFDQIRLLLSKFDLHRSTTLGELDNVAQFRTWAKGQLESGNIPPNVESLLSPEARKAFQDELHQRDEDGELIYPNEEDQALLLAGYIDQAPVRHYKEATVEELLGLRDAVKQIEHIGKRTQKVLTDRKNRLFTDVVDEIKARIVEVAKANGRQASDTRTPNDQRGREKLSWRGFFFSHVKAANEVHIMDGGDAGPMWEHLIRTANDAGNGEVLDLAQAHDAVQALLKPLKSLGVITDTPQHFPSIGRSLNRQARIVMALNLGNESNAQRLLGGEGWTMEQAQSVLDTLTAADWQFVQGMWDLFEAYRPRVAEMERLIRGVEPEWIEARPLTVRTADGQTLNLRGGYAPVIYDPRASGKADSQAGEKEAKAMMQAARVASTVSRSFTKARVEEVKGRPLLLSLDAVIGGIQDTIHYLHWQPWIIDANRLIKAVDPVIREHYGAEQMKLLREWAADNAAGVRPARDGAERRVLALSRNVSYAGLAFNVMSAVKQVTGYTQSIVVVGAPWLARGLARSMASPRGAYLDAVEKSTFMRKRATTRMRDLAETQHEVQDVSKARQWADRAGYSMMLAMQTAVDVPTWWGAYEKAIDAGVKESDAVARADQAVIDAQGSGMQKDLASVERATGAIRLLTGFMSFMNTTMNLNYRVLKSDQSVGAKAVDLLLINTIPVMLGSLIGDALTPGGGDDEPKDVAKKLLADQVGFLFGQMVGLREFQQLASAALGLPGSDYGGSVGLRIVGDSIKLAKQAGQGEMDGALIRALINASGLYFRLPSAQLNKTLKGVEADMQGSTEGPYEQAAAPLFGFRSH